MDVCMRTQNEPLQGRAWKLAYPIDELKDVCTDDTMARHHHLLILLSYNGGAFTGKAGEAV